MQADGHEPHQMSAPTECPFCGCAVEAIHVDDIPVFPRIFYPDEPGAVVREARELRVGSYVLMHHGCLSSQVNTDSRFWDPDRSWWACKDPTRAIDRDASFDLNCAACAQRWVAEGRN